MAYAYRRGARQQGVRTAARGRRHAGLIAAAAAVCAWEGAGRLLAVPVDLLPTPSRILVEISRRRALFCGSGCLTLLEAWAGLGVAAATALLVSLAVVRSSGSLRAAERAARGLALIPPAAAAPILLVWLGFGVCSRAAVAWSSSVLFLVHGITAARRRMPHETADWLRATGAGWLLQVRKVYAPGLLPVFVRDLRRALPLAVGGALTAEVIGADAGLGHLMVRGAASGDLALLFAALCLAVLFVGAAAIALRMMEKRWFAEPAAEASARRADILW